MLTHLLAQRLNTPIAKTFRQQMDTLQKSYQRQNQTDAAKVIDAFIKDLSAEAGQETTSAEALISGIDTREAYAELSDTKRQFLGFCILEAAARSVDITPIIPEKEMKEDERAAHKRELENVQDIIDSCQRARIFLVRQLPKDNKAPTTASTLNAVKMKIRHYEDTEEVARPQALRSAQLILPDSNGLGYLQDEEILEFKQHLGDPGFDISNHGKKLLEQAAASIDPDVLSGETLDGLKYHIFKVTSLDGNPSKASERSKQLYEAAQRLMQAAILEAFFAIMQKRAPDDEHAAKYTAKRQAAFSEILAADEQMTRALGRNTALPAHELDHLYQEKLEVTRRQLLKHPDKGLRIALEEEPEQTLWREAEAARKANRRGTGSNGK